MSVKRVLKIAAAAGGLAAGSAVAGVIGNLLWNRAAAKSIARLLASTSDTAPDFFSPEGLQDLPAPVARYFGFALTPGQPIPHRVQIAHAGKLRSGGIGSPWNSFTAVQHFTSSPPGFVWASRIHIASLLTIQVRDSYIGGTGAGQVRFASLFSIAGQSGKPELNAGALHRYLAEAVWCPIALLPSRGVVWEPINDSAARATLTDGGTSVSLEFGFGEQGEIVRAYTPARFREVKGDFVPTPWTCHYSDYARINAMMTPLRGEMEWTLPEGHFSCFRSHLLGVTGSNSLPA